MHLSPHGPKTGPCSCLHLSLSLSVFGGTVAGCISIACHAPRKHFWECIPQPRNANVKMSLPQPPMHGYSIRPGSNNSLVRHKYHLCQHSRPVARSNLDGVSEVWIVWNSQNISWLRAWGDTLIYTDQGIPKSGMKHPDLTNLHIMYQTITHVGKRKHITA